MSSIESDPVINLGEITSIDKSRIFTNPAPLLRKFGDIFHINVRYGCSSGLNGIKYGLFVVDRATRYKLIYDIKSLKTDILLALKVMINDIGHTPGKIVSSSDHKLMEASVQE